MPYWDQPIRIFYFHLYVTSEKEIYVFNFVYNSALRYAQLSTCCRNEFMEVYLHFLTGFIKYAYFILIHQVSVT